MKPSKSSEHSNYIFKYPVNMEEYVRERVRKEIKWHGDFSFKNKRLHYWVSTLQIIFGASATLLTGFSANNTKLLWAVGVLGALGTIATGVSRIFKFQELWIQYRNTAQSLKKELSLFQSKCKPYDNDNCFPVFVERIETILDSESSSWSKVLLQSSSNQSTETNSGKTTMEGVKMRTLETRKEIAQALNFGKYPVLLFDLDRKVGSKAVVIGRNGLRYGCKLFKDKIKDGDGIFYLIKKGTMLQAQYGLGDLLDDAEYANAPVINSNSDVVIIVFSKMQNAFQVGLFKSGKVTTDYSTAVEFE